MKNFTTLLFLLAGIFVFCHSSQQENQTGEKYQLRADDMWIAGVEHGISSFHDRPDDYRVYRNVMDFGCRGDGVTDDTICINLAISSGTRCGNNCGSSTTSPALVYFPAGRYLVTSPIIMYYFTQLVGNALDPPILVAAPSFSGMAVIDSNPYGDGGWNWYTNQNNFFRQIRNFVIDTTQTPDSATTTGIHWQVAQATSLVNIYFKMSTANGNNHQGIWMENGSGGFMADLTFEGGKFGMWVGNQQFLSRNMTFDRCNTAIYINWNWQWTFKNLNIRNCFLGIDMSATSNDVASGVGSVLLMDSNIQNTPTGVRLNAQPTPSPNDVSGTLLMDNVRITDVAVLVADASGTPVFVGGTGTVPSWGRGSVYQGQSGIPQYRSDYLPNVQKSANLLDNSGNFFERGRPQYEGTPASDFVSVKAGGARGDGRTDDSDAIQRVINENRNNGKIVYFPAGSYILAKTVKVPSGVRIIGETWSVLMANGQAFQSENNPQPMLQVGDPGEVGTVEITDLMFCSQGAQPGAILVQWNMKGSSQGAAGMWDSHFRVGGTTGSNLQVPTCPRGQGYRPECVGVHTLLHITESGSGIFENVWAWTADHDLDNHLAQGQVTLYTGRGVIIESTEGPVWLYGTQSEHNVLSQYQLKGARNVFMTMIQSETPYWQPGPPAPQPFTPNSRFDDPTYAHCAGGDSIRCAMSWSIRAVQSTNIYIYGAGMYNFFNNYDQTCLETEDCQTAMVDLEGNTNLVMYNANTKAAVNMVVADNTRVLARSADNKNGFCQTINAFIA